MFLFILLHTKDGKSKIGFFDTDFEESFRILILSDKLYTDLVVSGDQLFCLEKDSITLYKIIGQRSIRERSRSLSPIRRGTERLLHPSVAASMTPPYLSTVPLTKRVLNSDSNIKLLFHSCIKLQEEHQWITVSDKNVVVAGGDGVKNKSIAKIHIVSDEEYTIANIGMEKAYNKLFSATDELCCQINREKRIITSVVTSNGTYYLLLSMGEYFLIYLDEEACKCSELEGKIISISNSENHLIAFIKTERGFCISRANEIQGLISKTLHDYELNISDHELITIRNI
ncbi:MAG: hypothetical protein Solivirus9_4 [Solivirus sp.]|uniref:Uncharacterized protein n=1 Tax=Solivirus sp. TaxID=2487772 RepID=A0A3G5AJK7_9VIRU|nr:MAG: hypothetical protein Solivirus9_4 [Solivirus sp.]